ncbi:MAG: peptidase M23 [Flavobacteriales bacterium]|nr:MAG: peptidase M23 [Flavobacteriales bacterium]
MNFIKKYRTLFGFTAVGTILFLNLYLTKKQEQKTEPAVIESENISEEINVLKKEYGFAIDSFIIHKGTIKKNQFLADILLRHHVSYPEIDRLVKKAKDTFDVRKIRAGKNYCILNAKDSTEKAQFFIYEQDPVNYVVFDLRDTFNIYTEKKEVEIREKVAFGTIKSSLYETLLESDASVELAMALAEIYAWTIDFYRIQKGDEFKVVYEEKYVEGNPIGIGKIKSADFIHKDEHFYAFHFDQSGIDDYFDENAKSLRKTFLKAPLKFSRISSKYSLRRFHPVQKRYKAHLGTDYAAPKGTPIMSVGDGEVKEAGYKKYNGRYVKIRHNGTYTTQYLHMSKIAKGLKKGKFIRQGDVIGYVGSSGLATGPHVCFRFWKNGKQVNHLKEKFPAAKPVKEIYLEEYLKLIRELKKELEGINTSKIPV